ncbi:PREDICTED: uncharacterized protein LOC104704745 [Camelina sativa]|uniref:Uncharacterized protein LOC104704745 n=1 Tax=Camelina sativa TaxID=90675 RepID=A0ABM0T0T5_CAMSA|nr:PREDICTED: uncharacterized protein LOC104704745 [Camelina sativa]
MLLWTISDFPAYGNLAGCNVKGKMGCPICGKNTDSKWLKFSRKHVYMCHRKGLAPTHSYRKKKTWFDRKADYGRKGRILTGREISQNLKNFKNEFGNVKESGRKRKISDCMEPVYDNDDVSSESEEDEEVEVDQEGLSRWKKRSIFFKLAYWEDLPVRHNLDVMHVEKNVAASFVSTLLHCDKSKDGLNARKDLEDMGPDGYCSNISRGVSLEDCKVTGLKSHDYHVLMQQLLPVALRGLLPKGPRTAILRLCAFFNHLCQRVIDIEVISVMEAEIMETLCMFERYMKVLKEFVRNLARPEGCIAESYMAEECMQLCSDFLKKTTSAEEKLDRNIDYENSSILEGRPLSAGTTINLTEMEKNIAHLAVIQNMAALDPYIHMASNNHEDIIKWLAYGPRCTARSYIGYIVNGQRFHTSSLEKQNQNSGVYYETTAMCRSSAKDTSQVVDLCQWAVRGNRVKIEVGFTLVNLNQSQVSFLRDPYILASQAKQIFYSREDDSSNWHVVMRSSSRTYSKEDDQDGPADIGPMLVDVDMDVELDEAEYTRADCEGIYVSNVN